MTSKYQYKLPKRTTVAANSTDHVDVEVGNGRAVLTPLRVARGDAVRAKLAKLDLSEQDIANAVTWARKPAATARKK